MSFRACMETNDMQLVTTKLHTVTSRELVYQVPNETVSVRLLFAFRGHP